MPKNDEKSQLIEEYIGTLSEIRNYFEEINEKRKTVSTTTILQRNALYFLRKNPKLTAGMLAKKLDMSSSATTQLTERLTKAALIRRSNDKMDRRIVHLVLTEKGNREIEMHLKFRYERIKELASFIPEKNLREIIRIHKELVENIKKVKNEKKV